MNSTERELRAELAVVRAALDAESSRATILEQLIEKMTAAHQERVGHDPAPVAEWSPPRVLPPWWALDQEAADGARYLNRHEGFVVILSAATELDGKRWVHLSMSHHKRPPRWEELREAKDVFIGERFAYQVLPPPSQYVNIDHRVLHLWHCLDGDPLPDFTRGGRTI